MPTSLHRLKCSGISSLLRRSLAALLFLLAGSAVGQAQSGIKLVQHRGVDAGTTTTASLAFASANTAGNWIGVAIRGGLSSSQVFTVVDSNGNTYKKAAQIGFTSTAVTLAVYYAENIKGGANTVTVSMSVSGPLRFAILEYSGVAASNSMDATATATGTSTAPNSGNLNTTASGDLLLGAIASTNSQTFTAGSGSTAEDFVPTTGTKLLTEDQIQAAAGAASASATISSSDTWGAVLAAFKSASGTAGPNITSLSPTAGAVGTSVTITGTNFGSTQSSSTVTFNGTAAVPTSWSATSIVVPVPGGATTGNVVVTVAGVASNGVAFTVTTAPTIASLSPSSGPVGTSVTIAGANFGSSQGSSTVTFNGTAGVPTSWSATSIVVPVPNGAATGNVVVTVGGVASNGVAFTVTVATNIKLVQTASLDAGTATTASLAFTSNNTAGNWIAIAIRAGTSSSQVFTVTDSNGNTYQQGAQLGLTATPLTLAVYYAENIKGGANTVTVSDTVSGPLRIAILEYSGIAISSSIDGSVTGQGSSATPNSGNLTTAANGDLLLGAIVTVNSAAFTAGSGYTIEDFVPAEPNTKLITEDQVQAASGTTSAGATIATSDNWGAVLVAVKIPGGVASSPSSITATAGTPQSATVNTAFATQLQATVKDSSNNPVSGVTVTFTAPSSGASGTFAAGVKTATTNAQGVATAAVFTANNIAGGYTVTASVTGVATPANFSLTNLAGAAATITAAAGTPQSATVNTAFATQLQATVNDSLNNPVSGVTVTFTAPTSGASGTFAGGVNTATTNAQGIATAAVFTANSIAGGPYNVTASATGVATPANFSLTNLGNPPASITATAGTPQSATISTAFTTQLQVTVKDASNNPVNGVTVTFTAPSSGASGTFAGGANTATTNAQGVATAAVFTANSIAGGPYNVTASVAGVSTPANFSLTNLTGAAASVTATTGTPQSATINTAFATQLQATVTDSGNNPLSGVTVTFAAPATGASGTFAGGVTTATTNAQGVATAAVFTANSAAGGPYTVTATATGVSSPANFSLTNLAGAASSITSTAGTPQSATVNAAFATQLQAAVKDSFSNPVSGATVTFTAPSSGASGTFAGGVNTATTNAQGVATAPVFTANSSAGGPYTVTATVTGVSTPASFSLTNTASVAVSIALVQHTSKDIGTTTTGSIAFKSNNTAGNWIAVVVRAGLSSSQVFTVTDSNGNSYQKAVQIGFTASAVTMAIYYAENIKGGANTVTVSDTVSGPLRFAILEYSGVATSKSLDVTAAATATSTSPNSGNLTTTANGDLLLGGIATTNPATFTAGTGYTIEEFVGTMGVKLIAEDQIQTSGGIASASATLATSDTWGALLAAFKNASAGTAGPSITSLSQNTGAVGVVITITGTNFGASQGTSTVAFNGTTATPQNWNTTTIMVPVPAGATTGPVVVTVAGVASNGVSFTVIPAPSISSVSPTSGPLGTSVTITGTNFGASQGTSTVTFNTIAGSPTSWSATSIVVLVPNGATTGNVVVTVAGSASNGVLFTVTTPGPSISSLSLTQGPVGATFTVNGANFGATQGSSTVTLNGIVMTAANWAANNVNVTVPSGATTGNVVVTVNGVASNGVTFTVTPPPAITSISPTAGPVGTNVVITGTNFGPTVGTIQSFVTFNGSQTRASNWTNTSITAPVPTGATTGNVVVNVGGVPSNGVLFTVAAAPSITGLSPTSGPVGTAVTITGTNFGTSQGTSTVTFNGTSATPTNWSATSIVAPVPTGATTGNVVVTVSTIASNGVSFTVTSTSNNISLVQHRSLDAGTSTSGSLAFTSNNTAGNWIGVVIRGGLSSSQAFTVTDSNGNTYKQAFQLGLNTTAVTFAMYYAENIKGGTNTVTVSDTVSGPLRFAILEYSGVATSNSLDATPATAQGNSSTPNSGSLTTAASGDLLLGTIVTTNGATVTAGSGYIIEESVPAPPNTKLVAEDQLQITAGTASASASLAASDNWGAGLAAFRSINGTALPITVSVSPSTASVPSGYGTQNFTATVTNDFQNRGATWSLSGAGCSGSTCGTLSNVTTTSVTYAAPPNVPSPATVTLTATAVGDNTKTASATITVMQGTLNVAVSPRRAAVTLSASQTVQFTATITNDPQNLGVTWQVDGNNGGNSTTGTVSATGLYTPGTQAGQHTVTAVSNANANISASAMVAVTDLTGVYTHHNDNARTGQNLQEYGLTPSTVNSASFGQLFSCSVDGFVYAQPLWVAKLTFGTTIRNVVFIATEHDSVYAFDADSPSCVQLWQVNFLGTGVTTMTPSDINGNTDIVPEIGITSTPVIDPATNTLYVMPKTKETVGTVNGQTCSTSSPCFVHRLHALDLITGAEKFGGPVVISATNFVPYRHLQRPGLLLANNTVYIAFGSHGDQCTYQGWVMGYDPSTLAQKFVTPLINPSPSAGCNRGGIWQSGAGPAVDASGNVYVSTGNGFYDGVSYFGDSAVKLSPTGSILDWFTPFNQSVFNANDIDLGSGGILILPSSVGSAAHPNLALATGKVAILYLLDQNNMGKFNSSTNNDVQEVIPVPPPNTTLLDGGNYGNVAYWNGNIYTTGQNFPLSQFQIANGTITTPQSAKSSNTFPPRGGIPVVSANGTTGGVTWIIDYTGWQSSGNSILDAYDATNVGTLLFSSPSTGTGAAGPAVKWTLPTVANGRVYVGAQYNFTVFGLLP